METKSKHGTETETAKVEKPRVQKPMTIPEMKELWNSTFPGVGIQCARQWNPVVFVKLCKNPMRIKMNLRPKEEASVKVTLNDLNIFVPRGKPIMVPAQVYKILYKSGHESGNEYLMHTNEVRQSMGREAIGGSQGEA